MPHALITGASSGIGEALARELHAAGYTVSLVARRLEKLEQLCASLHDRAHAFRCDLSDPDQGARVLAQAEAQFGPIDLLVNNAGVENTGPTAESDVTESESLLRTNLLTPLRLTRLVLPGMLARKSGVIVQVASMAAVSGQSWYGASKAGLAMFSETLRNELRKTGVHVVTVYPGPVRTPMADNAYARFGGRKGVVGFAPEGTAGELAKLIRRAVERRRPRVVYPGFYALGWWFPRLSMFVTNLLAPQPLAR